MSEASKEIEVLVVRSRLEKLIVDRAEVTGEQAREFSFHMTDWLQDMEDLRRAYKSIHDVDDEYLFSVVLGFLLHVPAHVVSAASTMTGETTVEILI